MKIQITEQQHNRLFEAMQPNFRLDYLASCNSFSKKVNYCKQMLGKPIGNGSSRVVFQIDDETCLKLAKNTKGVAQNVEEIRIGLDNIIRFVPKVFNGSDEENGLWIITQYVLPAKASDFKKVFGATFADIAEFARYTDIRHDYRCNNLNLKHANNIVRGLYDKYNDNETVTSLFSSIEDLKASYEQFVGDLTRIENWGMAMKNGKPTMVMLDTGLAEEVFKQYYRK